MQVVAHDVADGYADPATGESEHVEPVAADVGVGVGGAVADRGAGAGQDARDVGLQGLLELMRGLVFVLVEPGAVQRLPGQRGQVTAWSSSS